MTAAPSCVFCTPREEFVFHRTSQVIGIWDAFPVSEGHALLVTKRHVASWFDATETEQQALTAAIRFARIAITKRFGHIDGYNLGINIGDAAGQTIPHCHLHVIPRRTGDVADPRGGVRHVIPARANYLAPKPVEPPAPPEPPAPALESFEGLKTTSGRYGGQLFVFIDQKMLLVEPDRVALTAAPEPRPGEPAIVWAKAAKGETWRYLGVGRQVEDGWAIPPVDFATWKLWGEGRDVSRRLPGETLVAAEKIVEALVAEPERWIEQPDGRRARVLGRSKEGGGVRIDGGKGGFKERTVSLVDIAWVLVAREDVRVNGGLLDEERVNRLRYLEGTPKGSTRSVDTGWAIACVLYAAP